MMRTSILEQRGAGLEQRRLNFREIMGAARRILAPVLIYFLISITVEICFLAVSGIVAARFGETSGYRIFLENESLMMMLLISVPAALLLYRMFRKDEQRYATVFSGKKKFPCIRYVVFAAVGASVGLNILIQLSPLIDWFPSIMEVNEELAGGSTVLSVLYVVLVAPFAEELLLRGLVFRRSREYMGFLPAAVLSALIFGAMHANMVQFIYAFLLGLILAYVYECYGVLRAPILFHAVGNFAGAFASVFTKTEHAAAHVLPWAAGVMFILFALWACVQIKKNVKPPIRRAYETFIHHSAVL